MKKITLLLLVMTGCYQPEIEDKSLISSANLNVKSVRTYYIDEYGDQIRRDGDLIGKALFGNDGSLMNIKTTNSKKTKYQSNAYWIERYEGIPVNRLLRVLDGGAYGQQWKNITPFLTGGPNHPTKFGNLKVREVQKLKETHDQEGVEYNYQVDSEVRPQLIETFSKVPMTGNFSEMSSRKTQKFRYDSEGRITHFEVTEVHDLEGWPASNFSESFQYNTTGLLTEYQRDKVNVKVSRNDSGFIDLIEIFKNNNLQRWYTVQYLDNNLRQSSQAFNANGELEFTVDYVYEYYN